MKTLNEFRKTHNFNITGMEAQMIVRIYTWLDQRKMSVIGLANIDLHNYVVRVSHEGSIKDLHINTASGAPYIMQEELILAATTPKKVA
jgi:hypothetical protein